MRHTLITIILSAFIITGCNNDIKKARRIDGTVNHTQANTRSDDNKTMKLIYNISWGITEDGFNKIAANIIDTGLEKDGFAYTGGMRLKSNGISGFFDIDNHLNGIRLEFSDFVIGEAPDYSDAEKRKIHELMMKNNEKIASLIAAINNVAGQYRVCGFDENDTDFYLENGTNMLAEWITDTGRITLVSSNQTEGTGCHMNLILERRQ